MNVKEFLEDIYERYNKPEYIHPDPLEFVYHYEYSRDREIAGLIASSLAYGKVDQILSSVDKVLRPMGKSPCSFLMETHEQKLYQLFGDFRYRFTDGQDLCFFLSAIRRAILKKGSLENLFFQNAMEKKSDIINTVTKFITFLSEGYYGKNFYLLPSPGKGSACKRMMMYLRWMVRKDYVDPGVWTRVSSADLIIPLDTHMYKTAAYMKFTKRKIADLKTALEITEKFKMYSPDDPVKYDFALTRFGIRPDLDYGMFQNKLR